MPDAPIIFWENEARLKLAQAVSRLFQEKKDEPILLLVSGGSVLKALDFIDLPTGANITISLLDDRFSREPAVNNFLQLTQTKFFEKAVSAGAEFISSLPEEGETLEAVASHWEKKFQTWDRTFPANRTIIAIMGMGEDGHTAGLMPFPENPRKFAELFENDRKWIVGYDAGKKNQFPLRLTSSVNFIEEMIDRVFVYVVGKEKKKILQAVLKSRDLAEYPACVIHRLKKVEIYTDIKIEDF